MSRTGARNKSRHKDQNASKSTSGSGVWKYALIIALAATPFLMGKYIEFNSPGPYDSASNVYSAKKVVDGAIIGVDEKPSAAIGTLIINIAGVWIFGFNEIGPKLIQGLLQASALIMMFFAMRKLFGTLSAVVSLIVASVYLSSPLIAKFGNVKEQYMIAMMVMSVSCLIFYELNGKWWCVCLCGALASWVPLFKPTGFSVIGAIGVYVILQPILKKQKWGHTFKTVGLLVAGAIITVAPIYIWLIAGGHQGHLPYAFLAKPVMSMISDNAEGNEAEKPEPEQIEKKGIWAKLLPDYTYQSWNTLDSKEKKEVTARIFRYYRLLILPVALALGAIIAKLIRLLLGAMGRISKEDKKGYDKFAVLLGVWWFFDMLFIWVSPRSYEQYYLPMNASAAMLGGYLIALYSDKYSKAVYKGKWAGLGLAGLVVMIIMVWPIFSGIIKSPHSGTKYQQKRRGYFTKLEEISKRKKQRLVGPWEIAGDYIKSHSSPEDKIYVWGWYPGIYVQSQRLSSSPKAFESEMHRRTPEELSERISKLVEIFGANPPKFIVDTHKIHFPWNRPPLELWPRTKRGFLPLDKKAIEQYDTSYAKQLHDQVEPDEALRYKAMKPLRDFVMSRYKIVNQRFGNHVLFELKSSQK